MSRGEAPAAVVSTRDSTRRVQPARQVVLPRVAPEELQPAVRRQVLGHELDGQLSLDHPSQTRYAQAHQRGLLCVGSDVGTSASLKSTQGAFLFHVKTCSFRAELFSDWG
jgi:hypothetical protein